MHASLARPHPQIPARSRASQAAHAAAVAHVGRGLEDALSLVPLTGGAYLPQPSPQYSLPGGPPPAGEPLRAALAGAAAALAVAGGQACACVHGGVTRSFAAAECPAHA